MSLPPRATLLPESPSPSATGGDQPAAGAAKTISSPTRPYLRRLSGVLRSRSALVVGPPAAMDSREVILPVPVNFLPSAPRRQPSRLTPIPRSTRDPWEAANASASLSEEQLDVVTAALHVTLTLLVERHPNDSSLADAKRGVTAIHVRNVVREAREHEARERWLNASRSWMRAALAFEDDAWLFAHTARTLLLTNASSQDAREVADRALGLDPLNPLARMVIERLGG